MNMKPTIYTSPLSAAHNTGEGHPESPARTMILQELFESAPFNDWPQKISTPATLEQIMYAHDEDYIYSLQDNTPDDGLFPLDEDTFLSPHSYEAALHAAGAVCQAVDDILMMETSPPACGHGALKKRAFCAVRPPGHHAEANKAMGFCLFNNIFIGARHAQEAHGIKKIAIIDFDVHHGNGTENLTRAHNAAHPDQPILYISSHGYPLFPFDNHNGNDQTGVNQTGVPTGDPSDNSETLLNIRLPDQCTSAPFRVAYEEQVFPQIERFSPDLLMISAGFDAHQDDPLAPLMLQNEDYSWVTNKLCDLAKKHCQNRVISVLEGGYNVRALKDCVQQHLKELGA